MHLPPVSKTRKLRGAAGVVPASAEESSRDERRAALVAAAYEVIAAKGLEGLRTRDVAALARVNVSTLHYYFGTKEALLLAVIDHVRHIFMQRETATHGPETLAVHLQSAWQSFQKTPQLSVVLQELAVRAHRDPAARSAFRALHSFWNEMVEDAVRGGVKRKELRPDLNVKATARIVTSFIIGATAQLNVNPQAFDYHDVSRELERWLELHRTR